MKQQRLMMGMPIMVEVVDGTVTVKDINDVYDYFHHIDEKFSTYKKTSEVCRINRNELKPQNYSEEMKEVLNLSEKTRIDTNGYFNI
ncbi:MAG: FAD:protein FMN transferase, partial [Candidatus Shapirobacteria bacterium]|nr:FAD:protein FMN transferase [Candidatus Shapirobacteria bacterium]